MQQRASRENRSSPAERAAAFYKRGGSGLLGATTALLLLGTADSAQAFLRKHSETGAFNVSQIVSVPVFEKIALEPFDPKLGILRRVDVSITGRTDTIGTIAAGAVPPGPYVIDVQHEFSGAGSAFFDFATPAEVRHVGTVLGSEDTPVFHSTRFEHRFSFTPDSPALVPSITTGGFTPPLVEGGVENFVNRDGLVDGIHFNQRLSSIGLSSEALALTTFTSGVLDVTYSYLPYGTEVLFDTRPTELGGAPKNAVATVEDSLDDDIGLRAARASAIPEEFGVGVRVNHSDPASVQAPQAIARAASGYLVEGADADFLEAVLNLSGSAPYDRFDSLDMVVIVRDGRGNLLAEAEVLCCGHPSAPKRVRFAVHTREEGGDFVEVTDELWSGRGVIPFLLPVDDGIGLVDVTMWGFAQTEFDSATLDFLNSAVLDIQAPPGARVTMASGQVFGTPTVQIAEPPGWSIFAAALLVLAAGRSLSCAGRGPAATSRSAGRPSSA